MSTTAFEILGLPASATPAEVKQRWRELCRVHHPDRGGNVVEFNTYRRAYLAAYEAASAPVPCPDCGGTGQVRYTSSWSSIFMPCLTCGGSGFLEKKDET